MSKSKKPITKVITGEQQEQMLDAIEVQRLEAERTSLAAGLIAKTDKFNAAAAPEPALPTRDELVEKAAETGDILSTLAVYEGTEKIARNDAKQAVKDAAAAQMKPLLDAARELKAKFAENRRLHGEHVRALAAVDPIAVLKRVPVVVTVGRDTTNLTSLSLYFNLARDIAESMKSTFDDLDLAVAQAKDAAALYDTEDMLFRRAKVALQTYIQRARPTVDAITNRLASLYVLEERVAADLAIAGPLPNVPATPVKRFLTEQEERAPVETSAANWDPIASQRVEPDVPREDPRLRVGADLGGGILRGPRAKDSRF